MGGGEIGVRAVYFQAMVPSTTRVSLLRRLREGDDPEAWRGLESAYRSMLLGVCQARGLQPADADDVVQNVFVGLVRGLRAFEYDPAKGRFRDYLFRCVNNAVLEWRRRRGQNASGEVGTDDGAGSESEALRRIFEREWVLHHYRRAVVRLHETCDPRGVEVLQAAIAGATAREIALSMGMTEAAVFKALARTRERLRELIGEQIREEDASHG